MHRSKSLCWKEAIKNGMPFKMLPFKAFSENHICREYQYQLVSRLVILAIMKWHVKCTSWQKYVRWWSLFFVPCGCLSLYAVFTLTLQIEDEAHKKYQYIVQELGYAYARLPFWTHFRQTAFQKMPTFLVFCLSFFERTFIVYSLSNFRKLQDVRTLLRLAPLS